jgi:anti-anti-sigma factor
VPAVQTVVVDGELDLRTADELAVLGSRNLAEPVVRKLVVDLSAVRFLDAAALGALVRIRNAALAYGKEVSFRGPSERAKQLFKLTGLDAAFVIEPAADKGRGELTCSARRGAGEPA